MAYDKLAVVTVRGMEHKFLIIGVDPRMPQAKFMRMTDPLTGDEVRELLGSKGYSGNEIEVLVDQAKQNPW
jgi:hypothetical protein